MSSFLQLRARHRFLLGYAIPVCAAAGILFVLCPQQRWMAAGMLVIGLASAWGAAFIAGRHLRRRLRRLREIADAMVSGDLSKEIEHPPHDDFLKLSDSLERIMYQLDRTMREQERLRQQLTRNEKLALIGELAATVAHEVNNPLDGLQNSTRIIRRNIEDVEQTRQLLDLMDAGLYRIEMIVRRLLVMSRDEPVTPVATRVDGVVDEAAVFVQPRLSRCSIELVCDFPEPLPFAMVDRNQFVQALINLMINAADSMPEGGTLTIRCRRDEERRLMLLDVIDTGTGIDAEHVPHIFEPFYSTKPGGTGTGLGLAVVSRIVEAHRGKITVHSDPGRGTRFRIELPAAAQQLEQLSGKPVSTPALGEQIKKQPQKS